MLANATFVIPGEIRKASCGNCKVGLLCVQNIQIQSQTVYGAF